MPITTGPRPRRRLGVDLRHLAPGIPGAGVEHASRELIQALQEQADEFGIELSMYQEKIGGRELSRRGVADGVEAWLVPSGAVSPFLRGIVYPWVHDLAIFEHPEWFPQSNLKRLVSTNLFLDGLRRARHIFAVSEDTKRAILRRTKRRPEDITVTYQGIWSSFRPSDASGGASFSERDSSTALGMTEYALILGTVEPRKNIPFIVDLWPDVLRRTKKDIQLVIAGSIGWGGIEETLRKGGAYPSFVRRVTGFDDAERDALIRNAGLFLLPSMHEGFGRTAVEALAAGVPVVASNAGALPEVLGSAAPIIDPADREAWIDEIVRALESPPDQEALHRQAGKYSWPAIARLMLAKIDETW